MKFLGEARKILVEINHLLSLIGTYAGETVYAEMLEEQINNFEVLWSKKDLPIWYKDDHITISLFIQEYKKSIDLSLKAKLEIKKKLIKLIVAFAHTN